MGVHVNKFLRKAFALKPIDAHQLRNDGPQLKKVLGCFDIVMLGVGSIVGSGVFVLTGEAASKYAGPGIVLSYILASLAALFSALCYAEFAVDIPVAGTSFNYIHSVYGEFMAWMVGFNLIMEYTLSCGSISKGFAGYLATMMGLPSDTFFIAFDSNSIINIDILGCLLILALSLLLCAGIKESSTFNNAITGANIATILFVLATAVQYAKSDNFEPFIPPEFGSKGVYRAAGIVFFGYLGFDGVATAAEEVRNVKKDLPIGIVGSLVICTGLYVSMAAAIVGMVRYSEIDVKAAFSVAFQQMGQPWASVVVSFGALTGIVSSLLLNLLGQARVFMSLGRERFLPAWIAKVDEKRQTPINATIVTFLLGSLPALLLNIETLASMVSIGMLFVLCLVCSGILWRSHYKRNVTKSAKPTAGLLTVIFLASLGAGLVSDREGPGWLQIAFLGIWFVATTGFCFLPVVYKSPKFNVPFKPYIPSLGMLFTVHLICSLGWQAYARFAIWQIFGVVIYMAYTMHHTHDYSSSNQHLLAPDDFEPDEIKCKVSEGWSFQELKPRVGNIDDKDPT
ncbi:hypothetical protein BSKO_04500 [Bryopsis sp. KO-2023]|nr:hypothetical protein BSKO_04500 [Bryopsis sp. KO-2023]